MKFKKLSAFAVAAAISVTAVGITVVAEGETTLTTYYLPVHDATSQTVKDGVSVVSNAAIASDCMGIDKNISISSPGDTWTWQNMFVTTTKLKLNSLNLFSDQDITNMAAINIGSVNEGDIATVKLYYGGEGHIYGGDDQTAEAGFNLYVLDSEEVSGLSNGNVYNFLCNKTAIAGYQFDGTESISKTADSFTEITIVDPITKDGILICAPYFKMTAEEPPRGGKFLTSCVEVTRTTSSEVEPQPTEIPSEEPTATPTDAPSEEPTNAPTETTAPSEEPTEPAETPVPEITSQPTIYGNDGDGICSVASIFDTTLAANASYKILFKLDDDEKTAPSTPTITGGSIKLGVILYKVPEDLADKIGISLRRID